MSSSKVTPEYFTNWFTFCPNCQNKLDHKQDRIACSNCQFTQYFKPAPTTSTVLHRKNQVLLVKRKIQPKKGWWDLPGGFLDLAETVEAGVIRELNEELGITLQKNNLKYLGSYTDVYDDVKVPLINMGFSAILPASSKLTAQDDVADYKWFTKESIPWKKLGFSSIGNVLQDFFKSHN